MSSSFDAFLRSWPSAPWLTGTLVVAAVLYARGWLRLHRRDPERWPVRRLGMHFSALGTIFLALASPIEPFSFLLFQVHMVQHLLLMVVAPPLLWLSWPLLPYLRGLPEPVRTYWIVPLLRWAPLRRLSTFLTHPFVAWPLFVAMTWLWHTPQGYELALSSDSWHVVEHVSFLGSALLFWYPVVRPYPARPHRSRWFIFPYLLLADVQNTLLAAWLVFSPQVLYPHYQRAPRIGGLSALDDQRLGGVLMWVPGSIAYLLPLFVFGITYLMGTDSSARRRTIKRTRQVTPPRNRAIDLLQVPYLGRILRGRFGRRSLQGTLAVLAACVIFDGLTGPQVAPLNLAGVLPWIHWRGLLILALLIAGNVFCMACPFTLPRSFARRWLPSTRPWPQWLRSKWLAAGLVAVFLWSYEAFALWDSPWMTAWIALGYFVAAFVVDSFFTDSAFCKYVCPIGQFNFVQSLMSPAEVTVRHPSVCATCTTHECLRGSETVRGCEMHLFQPRKIGNLDCTFCLDCVRACPHENVGVMAVVPGRALWADPQRSGGGRLSGRTDVAALILVLTFGAFANAAGMIAPVLQFQDRLQEQFAGFPRLMMTSVLYAYALIICPLVTVFLATVMSRRWSGSREAALTIATRYIVTLVPLGFGMWLAHYSYHFFTSWDTMIPTVQRFAADHGVTTMGSVRWQCACCRPAANWVSQAQILMLDFGLLVSLYAGFRIAEGASTNLRQAGKAFTPWAMLIGLLFVLGIWIILQPMEMRGTLPSLG